MAIIQKYYVYEMPNYQFLSSAQGGHEKGARGARGLKLVTRGSGTTRIATRSAAMPRCLLQGYLAGIEIILSHSHRNGGARIYTGYT